MGLKVYLSKKRLLAFHSAINDGRKELELYAAIIIMKN